MGVQNITGPFEMSDIGTQTTRFALPLNAVYVVAGLAVLDMAIIAAFYALSFSQATGAPPDQARVWQITDGIFCVSLVYMLLVSGSYQSDRLTNPFSQISRILVNATLLVGLEWLGLTLLHYNDAFGGLFNGPLNTISGAVIAICCLRLILHRVLTAGAVQKAFVRNVAVVGAGVHGERLLELIKRRKDPWTRIVGLFDDRRSRLPSTVAGYSVEGTVDQLISIARNTQIDEILVALPWGAESRLLRILDQLKVIPANVHLAPDVIGHHFLNGGFTRLDGVPVYSVFSRPISGWGALLKRTEDLVLGLMILAIAAPVMLLCAIAVKLDSPGPILFRQRRFGYNNNLIGVYKFRSMYHHMRDENASRLATQQDPRITRVGAFLRRTSLDELPQLFNVILGDMSLVGPRPHAVQAKAAGKLYQEVVREYAVRHRVKPGITGWAQVMGWRGETDTEEKIVKRVACDLHYLENWSLFLDIEILFRTIFAVAGKNVY